MKYSTKITAVALMMVVGTSISFAAPVVTGIWHGHVIVDAKKLPANTDPKQRAKQQQMINQFQSMKITLTLKGDHSFSVLASGGPVATPPQTGKWDLKGGVMSISTYGKNGKPAGPPQTFTMAKDGKSFSTVTGFATVTFFK